MCAAENSPKRRGKEDCEAVVKKEPEEDIKDYAETTMNELLGWYGYEKVDSRDTQGLNLQHFSSALSPLTSTSSTPELGSGSEDVGRDLPCTSRPPTAELCTTGGRRSGSPHSEDSGHGTSGCIVCAWCQKMGMKLFTLKTTNGSKAFCSELCFTQCRRASFKKNKVCDWCKHVRHTVNYVDFQDGEQQLQFCSDKCLNQYKMNIFCKETQAHLQMHTHIKEAACKMSPNTSVNLITPDLWLRDCKGYSTNNGHAHPLTDVVDNRDEIVADVTPPPMEEKSNSDSYKHRTKDRNDKTRKTGKIAPRHHPKETRADTPPHSRLPGRSQVSATSLPNFSHSSLLNGPSPALSSSPVGLSPRPPPPLPPLPSSLGIDPLRPPFYPPGLLPRPLNLHHADSLLRNQPCLGVRPPIPPPPWFLPPYSNIPRPPSPPQPPTSQPQSLLPPSTVIVPYPLLLPLPVPIPLVVPLPLNMWMERLKEMEAKREQEHDVNEDKVMERRSGGRARGHSSREDRSPRVATPNSESDDVEDACLPRDFSKTSRQTWTMSGRQDDGKRCNSDPLGETSNKRKCLHYS